MATKIYVETPFRQQEKKASLVVILEVVEAIGKSISILV